ncbi:serine/threonine protein kinase with WD-40 repeats [Scytonema sp. HK-05]|uniref:protein kinase domain-containing protein n=1 Tax=Scytonema sp. HK-05 TaxID=1137095 RepID=UPI000937B1C3|nr:protein kinase [Scytonema sp. HK-05]OKH45454.1 serine/threonine protein kinase [Scytonema sp. HK-05]BAY44509.1 serine/threonine protein kinase with WD-40 repeats [Scytonema sp. HK-05]
MIYCLNPNCEKPLNPDATFCQSCGTQLISQLRNRYRIIQPLGGGGFGRTFLAEDEDKLNEHCVVKQLAPQVQGTTALLKATELFQEEARRLQQLGEHPQIPTLYAYFRHDNYLYLVQQFILGQTLRQELRQQGTFSEEKIWKLLSELLPILKFIHEHQVIHRDIKPENIIRRSPREDLVLIDFGVAKQLTATSLQQTGTTIGSFGYAPIEQMKYGNAYAASDLFSLGVTCFDLLTGIHPSHLYMEHGYGWVMHWRQHLKSPLSAQLVQVLDKLLQKDMEHRYQSADELLQDLHQKPQPASIPRDFSLPQPPSRINPRQSVFPSTVLQPRIQLKHKLLAGGIILLLGLGGYIYWQSLGHIPTLSGHWGDVNSLAFRREGTTLASGSDDKSVKIWNLNNRQEIRTLKGHKDIVYCVAISPDGQTLVSGSKDNTIKIWNLKTGKEIRTLKGHTDWVNSVAISPDGQNIASGSYDNTIKVWNLNTGQELQTLREHTSAVLSVALSSDGKTLVSGSADRTIKVWNLNTGKVLRTLTTHSGDVNALAISPDGQMLASASDDKTVKVWKLNTGKEIRTLVGHSADVNAVAFSPDGEHIATGSDDKTVKIWNLDTGEIIDTLKGHSGKVYAVAFSPDGKTLVSGSHDKTIKIWQLP